MRIIKADWQADVMELEEEVILIKNETLKGKELYVFIEGKVADENALYRPYIQRCTEC